MEGARGAEDEVAMTSRTHMEGKLAACSSLEESFSHFFFSPARDALFTLLRVHWEEKEVTALMRGELVELGLGFCPIGDDGAEIVANFLKHDETVKKVSLWNCLIGPLGAKAFAEAMKHNGTVEDLSLNPIENEGVMALLECLSHNVCIKGLHILLSNRPAPELRASIQYLTETRNAICIPAAVRRTSLCLIAARRNITNAGNLAVFPKEIVKMIAMEVWASRKDPIWINALTESERTGKLGDK